MVLDMSDPFVVAAADGQAVDLDETQFAAEGEEEEAEDGTFTPVWIFRVRRSVPRSRGGYPAGSGRLGR